MGKVDSRACSVSNFEDTANALVSFSINLIRMNKKAYVCVYFIIKIRDATSL